MNVVLNAVNTISAIINPQIVYSEEDLTILKNNWHLKELEQTNRKIIHHEPITEADRIITPESIHVPYTKDPTTKKTLEHWGQRKLFMSELEFLTNHGRDGGIVIYVGAAPGIHTTFLAKLFPYHHFVLIDPAPFRCKETKDITIIQEYMTDAMAEDFAKNVTWFLSKRSNSRVCLPTNKNVLFISDVRRPHKQIDGKTDETDELVMHDMNMQLKWIEIIKPEYSMVKFRLPYADGTTTYCSGTIYFQMWAPMHSTETRLVIKKDEIFKKKTYINEIYNGWLHYFNLWSRLMYYPHVRVNSLCHCYDCSAELFVVQKYLKSIGEDDTQQNINIFCRLITGEIDSHKRKNGLLPSDDEVKKLKVVTRLIEK